MSLHLQSLALSNAPWEVVVRDLLKDEQVGKKKFAQVQRNGHDLAAFIIVGWDQEGCPRWWYSGGTIEPWTEFDDRVSEYPWIYKRLDDALKRIEWLQTLCRASIEERSKYTNKCVAHVGLLYWVHPEASDQPLCDYVCLADAVQYPGTPRQ